MPKVRLTPKEIADLCVEVLAELKDEGCDRTDWVLETLEKLEREQSGSSIFQGVRAELHRAGMRHSKAG